MKRLSFKSNKLWNSTKNFLYTSSLFWLCGIVWIAIADKWYGWYNKNGNAEFAKWIYSFLDENYLANIPLIIIFICFSIYLFFKIWRDNDCRLFRLFFPILGIFILYYDCQVDYANIIWEFDYRMLLTIFLSIILLIRLLKGIRKMFFLIKSLKNSKNQKINSFADEDIKLEEVPQNLRNYASTIAERLKNRNSDHSCAVGITGKWGSGKTTFLNLLKEELKNDADIVEFNPWMCRSPEPVTHDFFASLRHQLSPKYSKLSNPIKKYAKYINSLTFAYQNILGINIPFLIKEKSLFEIKQELSIKFSSLPRPVIVIIDDIDRLERDEVFEVLRLIRNTADLKNTNYLVAYDKEYVTCVLEEKNIKDASLYLEKIFQVEVHLPKVEEHLIWHALYYVIKEHETKIIDSFTEALFKRFTYDDYYLILRVLSNYRQAKRFARLFTLNVDYLSKKYPGEIKLLEVFWLELLQIYDKYTYDILCNDPYRLLNNEDRSVFKIKSDILDNIDKYNGEKFWKEETTNILKKIFNNYANQDFRSVCYTENYEKYFTFGVPQYKLSIKERNSLFKQNADIESIINGWIDNGKTFSSIIYQFSNIPINSLSDNQLPIYLNSILYCGIKIFQKSNNPKVEIKEVKNLLRKNLYNKYSKTEVACNTVSLWFEKKIDEGSDLVFLSYLLNNLYATKIYDQNGKLYPIQKLIIDNLKIENYLSKIISIYIENQSEFTAIDIVKEGNELFEIFDNCSVRVENYTECNGSCEYKQVAFNIVTEYFAKKEIKPALKEYQEAYDKLFHQTPPEYLDDEDVYQWYNYEYENIDNKMVQHFGSSFEEKLENFKTKCFIDRS